MTTDDGALTRIEQEIAATARRLAELLEQRAAMAADAEPAAQAGNIVDPDDGGDEDDLIDSWTASNRFNIPIDTIRWLCRYKGMGVKERGKNRWLVSVKALRRYQDSRSS